MTRMRANSFDAALADCASEPIHLPGSIQPHGILLTLSEPALTVQQISANAAEVFGRDPLQLLQQPLSALLGSQQAEAVAHAARNGDFSEVNPLRLSLSERHFDAMLHRHQGLLILELETHAEPSEQVSVALGRALSRLQAAKTLEALYRISVAEVQALTGYDRVMVYRFEPEGHGQVVAEALSADLPTYQGLFFPASDIPPQARQLYRLNWLRVIPDAHYQPVPLLPALRPDTQQPLDLSLALLRSVSPVHCQYLNNMGVRSSMSISLLDGEQLWGLITCGNRQPLQVNYAVRAACQVIGEVLSLQISALQVLELNRQRDAKRALIAQLVDAMTTAKGDVLAALAERPQHLLELTGATGAAILVEEQVFRFGDCPSVEQVRALYPWLQQQHQSLVDSRNLGAVYAPATEYPALASGLLAITLPKPLDNAVMWFRPEVRATVTWSGNPDKSAQLEHSETGSRLHPRQSFESWQEQVEGTARRWSAADLFAAEELRRSALEHDLARQVHREQEAVRARDDLVAVVSHDLRSPMSIIVMQCGMLQRLLAGDQALVLPRLNSSIEAMQRASAHMTSLLEDLLDASKIEAGRYHIKPQRLDVGRTLEEAYSLLAPLAQHKSIALHCSIDAPMEIQADPERLFQVLANLIDNAIKFTPKAGQIQCSARRVDQYVQFSVQDNGNGITAEQLPRIFERYWRVRKDNPHGSGLGLYICSGIVEAHGGKLWVESQPGLGSTFTFSIPVA